MSTSAKVKPQLRRRMGECLAILLDEIQLALEWSRPSILFAIHRNTADQERAMTLMEDKLRDVPVSVAHVRPENGHSNILQAIALKPIPQKSVYFIRGLGNQTHLYDGLNLHREMIVEKRLRIIFWLTLDELNFLSHQAPDFWAFRHRVIEFPSQRSSPSKILPSGVLLWHTRNPIWDLDEIRNKIIDQESLLQTLPAIGETATSHAEVVCNVAYLYWLMGANTEVARLLNLELGQIEQYKLQDVHSLLLNAQAINCYDQNKHLEALKCIEKALELNPNQSLLWSNHGVICRSAGLLRRSNASLKKAIKLDPASAESRGVLGYAYISSRKFAPALKVLEEALALHPDKTHFFPAVAFCHYRMENLHELRKIVQLMTQAAQADQYLEVCRDGFLEKAASMPGRLDEWMQKEKIPHIFIQRDPNLNLILGN